MKELSKIIDDVINEKPSDPEEKKPELEPTTKQGPATDTELDEVFEYLNF